VYKIYLKKKDYYDQLISINEFTECPCCGFGDIKTDYSEGHSPFDHYLPQKYFPFSTLNFDNLVPMCHICNSDYKGERNIIKDGQKVFYPFGINHPKIELLVDFNPSKLPLLINKSNVDKLPKGYFKISFNTNSKETESWDKIFRIKSRYSGKIADHRISWFNDVRQFYRSAEVVTSTASDAIDKVIKFDSHKHLGFIKNAYLTKMKSLPFLLKAIEEVSGSSMR
jgi:hypothetical protein